MASRKNGRPLSPKKGKWIQASAVRFNRNGTVSVRTQRNPRNVAAGFVDEDGIFHPIRASYDYSPGRVGEKAAKKRAAKKKPAKKKRAVAKRR